MGNVFEPGIISKYPVIQEIKDLMESNGARKAMMSGSGPTVFGHFLMIRKKWSGQQLFSGRADLRRLFLPQMFF